MSVEIKPMGRVRQTAQAIGAIAQGDDEQLALSQQLEQLIAQSAPPYSEIIRTGRSFQAGAQAAVAAVVAIPTTGHAFAIYNNEPDGGRSYVIDWIAAVNIVSTAVAASANLLVNLGQAREAVPTDAMPAGALRQTNGGGGSDTKVRAILTATALPAATGVAANWNVFSPVFAKAGAVGTPGYGIWQPVDGRLIVPPGRYLALHVLANVVGETFLVSLGWTERQLDLG